MATKKKQTTQQTFGASRAATTTTTTPAKAQNTKPLQKNIQGSKAVTSTPAKVNNLTASTATKNVSSTAPVTAKYTVPSAPAISTPTYTAPSTPTYTAPSTPSYTAPSTPSTSTPSGQSAIDLTKSAMEQTTGELPSNAVQTLYDTISDNRQNVTPTSLNNIFSVLPNETPTQRTERWLNASNLVSNAANNNAARNVIRNNANDSRSQVRRDLDEILYDATVGEGKPYTEVPNIGLRLSADPTKVVRSDSLVNGANTRSNLAESLMDNLANNLYGEGSAALSPEASAMGQEILERYDRQNLPDNLKYNIAVQNILDDLYGAGTTPGTDVEVNTGDYEGASGSGGGSRGGSGSSGGIGGGYDLNSLYDLINQQLAEYDNGYNTLMQNLLNAYNANYGSLNDSYLAALNALGLNYNDTEALLNSRFANSQQALEDQRRRAMQEAYIARMMDQKNIEDYLGASGFSGGATESILSSLMNNYRSNRNKIEENTQNSLRDLLQNYLDNLSTARQNYNSGLLNAENNRLSAAQNLANNLYESQANAASRYSDQRANVYQGLYNTLANLALKG